MPTRATDANKSNKKQRTKKHDQMLAQLTPSERALDESSGEKLPQNKNPSPDKETPRDNSKGKRRASNYCNEMLAETLVLGFD